MLLPEDADASAERLRKALLERCGVSVSVIVTDTFGRPWRVGLVNVAIGIAGMAPVTDLRGRTDSEGRALEATVLATADEIAAAAGLVMGKLARCPVVLVRGWDARGIERPVTARDLVRPIEEDVFR